MNATISNQWIPIGPVPAAPLPGITPPGSTGTYVQLPACVDDKGHRFAIGLYHKDRAVCERCGLIRKQDAS